MKTDDLIHQLSSSLSPVRPVLSPLKLAAGFTVVALLTAMVGLGIFHVREDLASKLTDVTYWLCLLMPFSFMVCAAVMVGRLTIPGRAQGKALLVTCGILLAALLVLELVQMFQLPHDEMIDGLDVGGRACMEFVLFLSALPMALLAFCAVRRAPVRPVMVGLLVGAAGIAAGELGITLHCSIDNMTHIFLWHFALPFAIGGVIGTLVLSKILRW